MGISKRTGDPVGVTPGSVPAEGLTADPATEDDVEGHNIGAINPILARELSHAREQDVKRAASRASILNDVKRAVRRKG